ncbi:TPA: hypothetical protein ACIVJN_000308, partial [Salmonella enterica subsp. enterica serovar Waycross]
FLHLQWPLKAVIKDSRAFRFRGVKSGQQVYQSQHYQRVKYAGKRNNLLLTGVINYRVNK